MNVKGYNLWEGNVYKLLKDNGLFPERMERRFEWDKEMGHLPCSEYASMFSFEPLFEDKSSGYFLVALRFHRIEWGLDRRGTEKTISTEALYLISKDGTEVKQMACMESVGGLELKLS